MARISPRRRRNRWRGALALCLALSCGCGGDDAPSKLPCAVPGTTDAASALPDATEAETSLADGGHDLAAGPGDATSVETPAADTAEALDDAAESCPAGAPCDDGLACTVDDTCAAGVCAGRADDALCDDGDPCTRGACSPPDGGCTTARLTGPTCQGAAPCDEGRCEDGTCAVFAFCEDGLVCTQDTCTPALGCRHDPVDVRARPAPAFALLDLNPLSATHDTFVSAGDGDGRVTVLLFHDIACADCLDQGEGARQVYTRFDDPDLLFVTVAAAADPALVADYVNHDADGAEPLTSTWPVVGDAALPRVWERYCAENRQAFVVGRQGRIRYDRVANLTDPVFRFELRQEIEAALAEGR